MFTLRQVGCNARSMLGSLRQMSASAGPLVDVAVDNAGVATVTMQRLPVNSLNLDLLTEMNKTLDDLAKNKTRGMILTSVSGVLFILSRYIGGNHKDSLISLIQFNSGACT